MYAHRNVYSLHSIEDKEMAVIKKASTCATLLATVLAAVVANSALAATAEVLKDTRKYKTYTTSLTTYEGCTRAVDPDHPKEGDCPEKRQKATIGGELVTRADGVCTRQTFSGSEGGPADLRVPSVALREDVFACDERGNKVAVK